MDTGLLGSVRRAPRLVSARRGSERLALALRALARPPWGRVHVGSTTESPPGARARARAPRVVDRVAGPFPPERGVEVGAWRLSLMMYWMLLLSMKQSSVPWHFPS